MREGYQARAAERFGLRLETLEAALRRRIPRRPAAAENTELDVQTASDQEAPSITEQNLLFALVQLKDQWDVLQAINPDWFQSEVLRAIFEKVYACQRDIREGGDPPENLFMLCENEGEREWLSRVLLLPARRFGGELGDFHQWLTGGFRLQIMKLKKQWTERRKRELSQDLRMILGDQPLGTGQLETIDRLTQENVSWHRQIMGEESSDKE